MKKERAPLPPIAPCERDADPILARLLALADPSYRAFHAGLLPTVSPALILGVRIPLLRAYAKELSGTAEAKAFLSTLPHRFYDENSLHALLLAREKDFFACLGAVERFLPFLDNWATCDILRPKAFASHPEVLEEKTRLWLSSKSLYTVRFGLGMLLSYFLGENYRPEFLALASSVDAGEYYVSMMQAWYFATALALHYEDALPYLEERRLDPVTHNRTVRKACESFRIPKERKEALKALSLPRV